MTPEDHRGWAKAWRRMLDHPALRGALELGVFTRLFLGAATAPKEVPTERGHKLRIERGELWISLTAEAKACGLSRKTLAKVCDSFVFQNMIRIRTCKGKAGMVVTLCNYEKWQAHENVGVLAKVHVREPGYKQREKPREKQTDFFAAQPEGEIEVDKQSLALAKGKAKGKADSKKTLKNLDDDETRARARGISQSILAKVQEREIRGGANPDMADLAAEVGRLVVAFGPAAVEDHLSAALRRARVAHPTEYATRSLESELFDRVAKAMAQDDPEFQAELRQILPMDFEVAGHERGRERVIARTIEALERGSKNPLMEAEESLLDDEQQPKGLNGHVVEPGARETRVGEAAAGVPAGGQKRSRARKVGARHGGHRRPGGSGSVPV